MNAIETSSVSTEQVRILIIGYGNPIRGDDAVGWVAAQKLGEVVDSEHVLTLGVHMLTPELAEPISRMDFVIFIDAAEDRDPGEVSDKCVYPISLSDPRPQPRTLAHHMTPQRLLTLAQRIYGRCPDARLFTIGGRDFGHQEQLSDVVEGSCDALVEHIQAMVGQALHHLGV